MRLGILPLSGPGTPSAAESLRQKGAQIVLAVVQGPFQKATEWAESAGADLALQSGVADAALDTDEGSEVGAGVPTLRPKDKGRGLVVLKFHVPRGAHGVAVQEGDSARHARAAELDSVIKSQRDRLKTAQGQLREILMQKISELETRKSNLQGPAPPLPTDCISVSWSFVDLTDDVPEAPAAAEVFKSYTEETGRKNLAARRTRCAPSRAPTSFTTWG